MKTMRLIMNLFIGALPLLLAGCDEEKYSLKFSHNLHVVENEMACDDCHGKADGSAFKAIGHATCLDCHDEPAAEEINQKTCGICHEEKQIPLLKPWEEPPASTNLSVFVHTDALAGKCGDCHGNLLDEKLLSVPKLTRADVLKIRNNAHASGQDCLACHVDMDRYRMPADHDLAWMKRHGTFGMQEDAACSVCHAEDSCKQCHSVMQPVSHNYMWRLRTHGVEAAWDRASCQVCHEEDSCTSCHSQVAPRSHGPLWIERHGKSMSDLTSCNACHGQYSCDACHAQERPLSHNNARWSASGRNPTHCIGCHSDASAGEGCVVCHKNGDELSIHEGYWDGVTAFDHNELAIPIGCYVCHWFSP